MTPHSSIAGRTQRTHAGSVNRPPKILPAAAQSALTSSLRQPLEMDFDPVHQIRQDEQQQQAGANLAPQACTACRKQKRKCDKILPSCSLCQRIGRPCDYRPEAGPPAPSPEDFAALRQQVSDLEQLLRAGLEPSTTPAPTNEQNSSNGSMNSLPMSNGNSPPSNNLLSPAGSYLWSGPTAFPSLYFLDSNAFTYERYQVSNF